MLFTKQQLSSLEHSVITLMGSVAIDHSAQWYS
jgi:hypothetical protein